MLPPPPLEKPRQLGGRCRPGIVEHESADLAQETIVNANLSQKVLGMVINGVKPNEFDRYSYHAKYSKNYFSSSPKNTHSKTATA